MQNVKILGPTLQRNRTLHTDAAFYTQWQWLDFDWLQKK